MSCNTDNKLECCCKHITLMIGSFVCLKYNTTIAQKVYRYREGSYVSLCESLSNP